MSEAKCPHQGLVHWIGVVVQDDWECGFRGGLCDRCQQDRADARTESIIKALGNIDDRLNELDAGFRAGR